MTPSRKLLRAILLAAAGVMLAVSAAQLREKKHLVDLTTQQIEDQIAALDPDIRAAVISRLRADAARATHDRLGSHPNRPRIQGTGPHEPGFAEHQARHPDA